MLGGMDDLTIRLARDDELDDVAALIVEAYADYAARMSPDAWAAFAQVIGHVRGRALEAETVVAERDGELVGSVTIYRHPHGVQEDTYGIRMLSVRSSARGSGIGRALMEHCISLAREEGIRRIVLTTTQEMDVARDMYDKIGFHRAPELDHEPAPGVRFEGYALDL
jgi:ribosomal protein S18 acetylase RimI-like enzyme